MSKASPWEIAIWIVNQFAVWFALFLAWRKRLVGEYRNYCLYLLCSALASAVLFYFGKIAENRERYAEIYFGWGYLEPVFFLLAISEVLRLTLGRFPAIEVASRRILRSVWVALALFGAIWYIYLNNYSQLPFPILRTSLSYQQAANTGFALFLIAFLAFVAFMPVPMSSTRLRHCFLLGGTFLILAVSRLIVLLYANFNSARTLASFLGMGGSALLLVIWALRMKPEEPDAPLATPRGVLNREEADVLLTRMEELNETVARSGPRILR